MAYITPTTISNDVQALCKQLEEHKISYDVSNRYGDNQIIVTIPTLEEKFFVVLYYTAGCEGDNMYLECIKVMNREKELRDLWHMNLCAEGSIQITKQSVCINSICGTKGKFEIAIWWLSRLTGDVALTVDRTFEAGV